MKRADLRLGYERRVAQKTTRWRADVCGRIVGVRRRASDRVNHGRLGPKGLYGWQANNADDRLLRPLVRRDGELREASWDEATDLVVERRS